MRKEAREKVNGYSHLEWVLIVILVGISICFTLWVSSFMTAAASQELKDYFLSTLLFLLLILSIVSAPTLSIRLWAKSKDD